MGVVERPIKQHTFVCSEFANIWGSPDTTVDDVYNEVCTKNKNMIVKGLVRLSNFIGLLEWISIVEVLRDR
jgi:hypothetical protein